MESYSWIIVALFLPLFPLGMVFNFVFQKFHCPWQRALLLLLWPLPGLWILRTVPVEVSHAVMLWALFSSLLYGFRAVVIRDLGIWTGFMATSAWSLSWLLLAAGVKADALILHILAFSLPLVIMTFLVSELERRYESAFAGIVNGVARAQPKLSGMLAFTMLAAIASPVFPAFFSMLGNVARAVDFAPIAAIGLVIVWLLWSWSGVRILQEMMVGTGEHSADDIGSGKTTVYVISLLLLIAGGLYLSGVLL